MSALKAILPLLILAAAAVTIIPMFLIWYVNDINTNVTVTDQSGVWTVFTHGLEMVTKIIVEFSYPGAVILIVCALAALLIGAFVFVKVKAG